MSAFTSGMTRLLVLLVLVPGCIVVGEYNPNNVRWESLAAFGCFLALCSGVCLKATEGDSVKSIIIQLIECIMLIIGLVCLVVGFIA